MVGQNGGRVIRSAGRPSGALGVFFRCHSTDPGRSSATPAGQSQRSAGRHALSFGPRRVPAINSPNISHCGWPSCAERPVSSSALRKRARDLPVGSKAGWARYSSGVSLCLQEAINAAYSARPMDPSSGCADDRTHRPFPYCLSTSAGRPEKSGGVSDAVEE